MPEGRLGREAQGYLQGPEAKKELLSCSRTSPSCFPYSPGEHLLSCGWSSGRGQWFLDVSLDSSQPGWKSNQEGTITPFPSHHFRTEQQKQTILSWTCARVGSILIQPILHWLLRGKPSSSSPIQQYDLRDGRSHIQPCHCDLLAQKVTYNQREAGQTYAKP